MIIELQHKVMTKEKLPQKVLERNHKQFILSGLKQKIMHIRLKLSLIVIATTCYTNPLDWFRSLRYLIKLRRKFLGDYKLQKMAYIDEKYYMGLYTPGWNSEVYKQFIASQLHDFKPIKSKANRFNTVFLAITKKCALQCDHCYEWDNLNKKDILSAEKINQIVGRLQEKGVSQIQFSGGEPLLKIDTLVDVINQAQKKTDFWVATSGYKLTNDNAYRLKQAGLTGVIISLDHFIPEKHNKFRHFKDAYYWVEQGVQNAHKNNLVVALSVCVTKEFISQNNLMSYMQLAKKLKVAFVQFLEPKAVGHYKNRNVELQKEHIDIIEHFFLKMNFKKEFNMFPIITYHGYYQRRQGCFSAGIKGFYIDTDGDINACPFCNKKNGNILDSNFEGHITSLQETGCSSYN